MYIIVSSHHLQFSKRLPRLCASFQEIRTWIDELTCSNVLCSEMRRRDIRSVSLWRAAERIFVMRLGLTEQRTENRPVRDKTSQVVEFGTLWAAEQQRWGAEGLSRLIETHPPPLSTTWLNCIYLATAAILPLAHNVSSTLVTLVAQTVQLIPSKLWTTKMTRSTSNTHAERFKFLLLAYDILMFNLLRIIVRKINYFMRFSKKV